MGTFYLKEEHMDRRMKAQTQTLMGVVIPYAWDENGNVSNVSLSATDDEEYVIENSFGFLDLLQQPIQATGIVKSGKKVHRMINVKKFQVLDHDAPFDQLHPGIDHFNDDRPRRHKKGRHRHEKKRARLLS